MSSEETPAPEPASEPAAANEAAPAAQAAAQAASGKEHVLDLTDPKAMRAIAHPVRMALLELMSVATTLTATQASEALGESPANCAFHLRTLAKYGYVTEAGGGKGRERPWKLANTQIRLTTNHDDADTAMTARTLHAFWLARLLRRAQQILTSQEQYPDVWRGADQEWQSVAFITPDELREVGDAIDGVLCRFKDRHHDASKQQAGAFPVELVFLGYPLINRAVPPSGEVLDEIPEG